MKKAPRKRDKKILLLAPYLTVKNGSYPIIIDGSGQVKAKNRIEIFSEVNGVMQSTDKEFREGVYFKKGDVMIKVDDSEYSASLYSKKSDFENLITVLLPDIKLEFPDQFDKWYNYLISLDIEKPIKELPEVSSQKEKFFITGRKIYSTYYTIKNMETRLGKYTIKAPFNGVVTVSNVNPGMLIRPGQKIGVFSNNDVFETEISIKAVDAGYISIGDKALIKPQEKGSVIKGKVTRINPAIDINTQTVTVFIESRDKRLKEGMFVNAEIECGKMNNVYEIPRRLLINDKFIYTINDDSTLTKKEIDAVRYLTKTVLTSGLADGTKIVSRNITGIFPGMKVKPVKEN